MDNLGPFENNNIGLFDPSMSLNATGSLGNDSLFSCGTTMNSAGTYGNNVYVPTSALSENLGYFAASDDLLSNDLLFDMFDGGVPGSYDMKVVESDRMFPYSSFGWIKSKEAVPEELKLKTDKPTTLLKRREEYGKNPIVTTNEAEYEKLYNKNYKNKREKDICATVFGILVGILMVVFFAVAALGFYFGITKGIAKQKAASEPTQVSEEASESSLDSIHDKYLSVITELFDGTYLKEEDGTIVKDENGFYVQDTSEEAKAGLLPASLEEKGKIGYFLNSDTVLALIALVLTGAFIAALVLICQMKKRRIKRETKMEEAMANAKAETARMMKENVSLLTKAQRKQYMWESILTKALINARTPVQEKDEDDDDDDDDDDDF